MSKKPNTASALAGILAARRGEDAGNEAVESVAVPEVSSPPPSPPPALPPTPPPAVATPVPDAPKRRGGKSSDKANYSQHSLYLPKGLHLKATRALQDSGSSDDFSDLVEMLVGQWLKSNT